MKVFQLNMVCGIKSTGRIASEIGKLVQADGGECCIACGAGFVPDHSRHFAYPTSSVLERKIYSQYMKLFDAEGLGNRRGTKKLIAEMERFQPDVVHLHNLHGCYIHLEELFTYLKNKQLPVVWTLHDCWPFTGHCAYFDYSGCEKWQTGCENCPQLKSYPVCYGLDGSKRNYELKKRLFTGLCDLTMVIPCQWMGEPLGKSFLKDYPVRTIYNGIDTESFRPVKSDLRAKYGLENLTVALAVASDWDERKGLRYLVEAARQLGSEYRIVAIGLTKKQIEQLPENILGIEHTANVQELVQWYSTADCLVNPSMEDNMPMVNLEALACGTPIAMFRTGGCPEAVDENTGIVVEKEDVTGLCNAVRTLGRKTPDRQNACIERSKLFDAKRTFEAYISLYRELCSR